MTIELYDAKGDQSYWLNGKIYPMVTARPLPAGTIHFNKMAKNLFQIPITGFCQIFTDTDSKRIYFKFSEEELEHSYSVGQQHTGSVAIHPKGFVRRLDIKKTTRYELLKDAENGMLYFDSSKKKRKSNPWSR